jgi:hypothetical protein
MASQTLSVNDGPPVLSRETVRVVRRSRCMKDPDNPVIALRDIFRQYIEAKREFGAIAERCLLKGWPDRKTAIQSTSRLGNLVAETELLRFEYLISAVPLDATVLKSFACIFERIDKGWRDSEEVALRAKNPTYQDVSRELEAAEAAKAALDPTALDGPFAGARGDPEFRNAFASLDKKHRQLEEQLEKLAARVPRIASDTTTP